MPYIKGELRTKYSKLIDAMIETVSKDTSIGEINYIITNLLLFYLNTHKECYATYNEMIGVLECAKMELYRRKIGKYEDVKIDENGDVY